MHACPCPFASVHAPHTAHVAPPAVDNDQHDSQSHRLPLMQVSSAFEWLAVAAIIVYFVLLLPDLRRASIAVVVHAAVATAAPSLAPHTRSASRDTALGASWSGGASLSELLHAEDAPGSRARTPASELGAVTMREDTTDSAIAVVEEVQRGVLHAFEAAESRMHAVPAAAVVDAQSTALHSAT